MVDFIAGLVVGYIFCWTPFPHFPYFALTTWKVHFWMPAIARIKVTIPHLLLCAIPVVLIWAAFQVSDAAGVGFTVGMYGLTVLEWLNRKPDAPDPVEQLKKEFAPPNPPPNGGSPNYQTGQGITGQGISAHSRRHVSPTAQAGHELDSEPVKIPYKMHALVLMVIVAVLLFFQNAVQSFPGASLSAILATYQEYPAILGADIARTIGGLILPWAVTGLACVVKTKDGRRFRWGLLFAMYVLSFISVLVMLSTLVR